MTPEAFFDLFLQELKDQPDMYGYYKFLTDEASFGFRKNYFLQRLRYIADKTAQLPKDARIWDCGCGYGTTALFLAMNGRAVWGTTLEFYYKFIEARKAFWSQYGDSSLFTCTYENLFDSPPPPASQDCIIVQDTLHHLEPIDEALGILHRSLRPNGLLLAVEENGDNIIQTAKLYKQRGSKRIITQWDEKLQKDILIGNENIRGLAQWRQLLSKAGFQMQDADTEYVRYYFPFAYKGKTAEAVLQQEQQLQKTSRLRKKYLFFGINFTVRKKGL